MGNQEELLNQKIKDCTFCCIDFETTGLTPERDEIIEIGAIKSTGFDLGERFETLLKPSRRIPIKITKITGIDMDMVMDKPTLLEIRNAFLNFLNGCILVEHSRRMFDLKFFKYHFKPEKTYFFINNLEMAKRLFPTWGCYDLISVAKNLSINIEITSHHKAIDDAKITMLCLIKFLRILGARGYYCISDIHKEGLIHVLK
jgi:DNA polymerase-3 subunit alpha (Gram-positive type)